jgi:hypothetical protein
MSQTKICGLAVIVVICLLLSMLGCADLAEKTAKPGIDLQETVETEIETKETTESKGEREEYIERKFEPDEQKPTAKLVLKFTPGDLSTYKVTTESENSVIWGGPVTSKPKGFTGGHTGNRIEMTFTRRIQSLDDQDKAVAEITIKELKYLAKVKDNIVLDFDSSRENDRNQPFSKLIGQSYTIEITPSGQVSKVIDVNEARAATADSTPTGQRIVRLLSVEVIKGRHSIPALPAAEKKTLRLGETWSNIKTFSFGLMGSKSYERIYELKEIKDSDDRRIAIAEMSVIPSSEKAKELHKEQATGLFSQMFDNPVEIYTGRLELDLTAGKIEKYSEEFRSEWIAVDPMASVKEGKEPDTLQMGAIRLHSIERID